MDPLSTLSNPITLDRWRQIQRQNFTNWEKLADFLELNESQKKEIFQKPRFILNLPMRLAQKIQKGTLDDPILKQFLPTQSEQTQASGFFSDPVQDITFRKGAKLLHKYEGRVLLVTTGACAMHCRYCFRQNFDYDVEDKTFHEELKAIEDDASIKEVILSGGDPLSLSNRQLQALLFQLKEISHVKRIRFHSRFPIGIPERIDDQFLEILEQLPQQVWFIIHCNHPNELDADVIFHLKKLQKIGVTLLNQSVLLKGVNDNFETLKKLCEGLADQGILPYYLHQLDRIQGAAHFEVSKEKGIELIEGLRKCLSGYAVPNYVQEIPGELSKTPIIV